MRGRPAETNGQAIGGTGRFNCRCDGAAGRWEPLPRLGPAQDVDGARFGYEQIEHVDDGQSRCRRPVATRAEMRDHRTTGRRRAPEEVWGPSGSRGGRRGVVDGAVACITNIAPPQHKTSPPDEDEMALALGIGRPLEMIRENAQQCHCTSSVGLTRAWAIALRCSAWLSAIRTMQNHQLVSMGAPGRDHANALRCERPVREFEGNQGHAPAALAGVDRRPRSPLDLHALRHMRLRRHLERE